MKYDLNFDYAHGRFYLDGTANEDRIKSNTVASSLPHQSCTDANGNPMGKFDMSTTGGTGTLTVSLASEGAFLI